jgi:hypothetical protein
MQYKHKLLTTCFLTISLILAVGTPSQGLGLTATPTLTSSSNSNGQVQGKLIVRVSNNIFEYDITDPLPEEVSHKIIAGRVNNYSVSPTGQYILYSASDSDASPPKVMLYDIKVKKTVTLSKNADRNSPCLGWSADGQLVTFYGFEADGWGLRVYTLATGNSSKVFTPPSAKYQGKFGPITIQAQHRCSKAIWIGSDRLFFQAYLGKMPSTITFGNPTETNPNSTALVTFSSSGGINTEKTDKLWKLLGSCEGTDESYLLLQNTNQDIFISHKFNHFADMETIPLPGQNRIIGFVPNKCELYGVENNEAVVFIEPATMKQRTGFQLGDFQSWVWLGDPADNIIATSTENPCVFSIVNVNTDSTKILEKIIGSDCETLAWLPSE